MGEGKRKEMATFQDSQGHNSLAHIEIRLTKSESKKEVRATGAQRRTYIVQE